MSLRNQSLSPVREDGYLQLGVNAVEQSVKPYQTVQEVAEAITDLVTQQHLMPAHTAMKVFRLAASLIDMLDEASA